MSSAPSATRAGPCRTRSWPTVSVRPRASRGRPGARVSAFLLQPRLGWALQAVGSSVRYDTGLDGRCREIASLVVAAHWRSAFEWYAHEAVGRSVGLDAAELAAVREGRHAPRPHREAAVARTAHALVARGDLDAAA